MSNYLDCSTVFYIKEDLLETMNGSSRGSSAKLEQVGQLILVKCLHDTPVPLDDLVVGMILSFVFCVGFPVLVVDVWHPIDEHLQLIRLEDPQ